ncbi:transmembrane protein, putative [Medicago truncatula]|uniref:Transmembrane protein, putative n=1 Tax=Medicago truncatula TaxID=3880 RepID=A0A072TSK7_MEDTR|nr:transmembrane protein, putative [Medicago truncatula]
MAKRRRQGYRGYHNEGENTLESDITIIFSVSQTGGHLGSNLGVVELIQERGEYGGVYITVEGIKKPTLHERVIKISKCKHSFVAGEGLAGLVSTYGLNLNVLHAWVIWIWSLCNVENKMILFSSSLKLVKDFNNIAKSEEDISAYADYVGSSIMLGIALTSILISDPHGTLNTLFGLSTNLWMANARGVETDLQAGANHKYEGSYLLDSYLRS